MDSGTKNALLDIASIAKSMKDIIGTRYTSNLHSDSSSQAIPPLHLPFPDDIYSSLLTLGLPEQMLAHFSDAIRRAVQDLQVTCSRQYTQACRALTGMPHSSRQKPLVQFLADMRKTYQDLYSNRYLPLIRTQIVEQASSYTLRSRCKNTSRRKPFNSEYTPLLEKYFEYNSYPSGPDRLMLARKSMMTIRQIEVWFQNHRNRAKREGRILRRLPCDPLPSNISLKTLEEKMPLFTIPKNEWSTPLPAKLDFESSDGEDSMDPPGEDTCVDSLDFLARSAPSHAFPSPYPPQIDYKPFPMEIGAFKFSPTLWPRQPPVACAHTTVIDFDEFIIQFASKLHLRAGVTKRQASRSGPLAPGSHMPRKPWFSAIVTVPHPAPLPALCQTYATPNCVTSKSGTSRYQCREPTSARRSEFNSPGPVHQPRKKRHLPRRTPAQAPVGRNNGGHSFDSQSRGSSLSSSRSCTSASSISSPPSNLTTPDSSPLLSVRAMSFPCPPPLIHEPFPNNTIVIGPFVVPSSPENQFFSWSDELRSDASDSPFFASALTNPADACS